MKFKKILKTLLATTIILSSMIGFKMNHAHALEQSWNYEFTGNYQTFTVPYSGNYKLETWGAQGGMYIPIFDTPDMYAYYMAQAPKRGLGGYSKGTIALTAGSTIYVYVGGAGSDGYNTNIAYGGFNGGGTSHYVGDNSGTAGGGGATDIRVGGNTLYNRVIVAGGGGGVERCNLGEYGGAGGGLEGQAGYENYWWGQGVGGTQTSGYSFGQGGDTWGQHSAGGGGGYYGGFGGSPFENGVYNANGGGGSGYIGGVQNGQTIAGTQYFSAPSGGSELGHSGHGYARVTYSRDTVPPTMSLSQNTYNWTGGVIITATAYDDVGVSKIKTPDGNYTNGSSVNYTVYDNNTYYFTAFDAEGNQVTQAITVSNIDRTNPYVSNVYYTNLDENGYDVIVTGVGDSQSGVNRIQFPTWTEYNGQDDIQQNWGWDSSATGQNLGNGTWKFHVNKSAHNNELSLYHTHVYVYDNVGNGVFVGSVDPILKWNHDATVINSDIPTTMEAGKVYTVHVTATNTGLNIWDGNYRLGGMGDSDPFANARQYLSNNIAPGQSYIFTFNMTAPKTPGTYTTDWQMLHEGVTWFGGNISKNVNVVDTTKPTITLTQNTTNWTSGNVTITVTGVDSGSGVKNIKTPDNNYTTNTTTNYVVTTNGTYPFVISDNTGNTTTQNIIITNIDKTVPTGNISPNMTNWTNKDVILTVTSSDTQSGVKSITKPDGGVVNADTTTYTASINGTYDFIITDNVGNTTTKSYTVNNIDKTLPNLKLTLDSDLITNKTVTINATASDGESGIQSITKPDGSVVNGSSTSYAVDKNNTYTFKATDVAGNVVTVSITVNNIITINTISGIDHIEYKLEGATTQDWIVYNSLAIVNEGITTIYARAVDKAGNYSDIVTSVVKLDRSAPINGSIKIVAS